MSNNVYFTEWQSKYGHSFRFEIHGAGAAFTEPNYIHIPKQSISFSDFEWEFEDVPLGIMSDTGLTVEWNLNVIDDITELVDMIFEPLAVGQLPTDIDYVEFETGNLYKIYCNTALVYQGVQLSDFSFGYDGSAAYKAEITGLGKHILTCFSFLELIQEESHLYRLQSKNSTFIVEKAQAARTESGGWLSNAADLMISVIKKKEVSNGNISTNHKYHFWSLTEFEAWLQGACRSIYNTITRGIGAWELSFELPYMSYFKQRQANALSGVGDQLTKAQTYIVPYITKDNNQEYIGGAFKGGESIAGYEVLYDYLADLSKDHAMKYFVAPNGLTFKPYVIYGENPTSITINEKQILDFGVEHFKIDQITCSLEEFTDNDVDNYRFNPAISRNANEAQIPIVVNTVTAANNFDMIKGLQDHVLDVRIIDNWDAYLYASESAIRLNNYYYFDNSYFFKSEVANKVSETCLQNTKIRAGVATGENLMPNDTFIPIDWLGDYKAYLLRVQKEHSKPLLFSKLRDILDNKKNAKIKLKVPNDGNFNAYFAGVNSIFLIDISKFHRKLSGYAEEWHLTKAGYDFETDCFELELFGVV